MGRPPKPTEVHRRNGNPSRKRLPAAADVVALPMVEDPPDPLRPLGPDGLALWARTWTSGRAWLASTDADLVQLAAEALDERVALRVAVLADPSDWRARAGLRALDAQVSGYLAALGFTPTDRARMGVAEVREVSKLDALRHRQAARRATT